VLLVKHDVEKHTTTRPVYVIKSAIQGTRTSVVIFVVQDVAVIIRKYWGYVGKVQEAMFPARMQRVVMYPISREGKTTFLIQRPRNRTFLP
jgi:hypothetical protein